MYIATLIQIYALQVIPLVPNICWPGSSTLFICPFTLLLEIVVVISALGVQSTFYGTWPDFTGHSASLISSRVVSVSWLPCCSPLTAFLGPPLDMFFLRTPSDFTSCQHLLTRSFNFTHLLFFTSSGNCGGPVPFVISVLWMPSTLCCTQPCFTRHSIPLVSTRAVSKSWLRCWEHLEYEQFNCSCPSQYIHTWQVEANWPKWQLANLVTGSKYPWSNIWGCLISSYPILFHFLTFYYSSQLILINTFICFLA
jgi:hypothetical protein